MRIQAIMCTPIYRLRLMGIMHIVLPTCIVIVLPISTVKTIGFTKRSIAINTVPNMQRLTNTIRYTPTAEWFIILPPHTAMAITIPNTTVQLRSMATKCWGTLLYPISIAPAEAVEHPTATTATQVAAARAMATGAAQAAAEPVTVTATPKAMAAAARAMATAQRSDMSNAD